MREAGLSDTLINMSYNNIYTYYILAMHGTVGILRDKKSLKLLTWGSLVSGLGLTKIPLNSR